MIALYNISVQTVIGRDQIILGSLFSKGFELEPKNIFLKLRSNVMLKKKPMNWYVSAINKC